MKTPKIFAALLAHERFMSNADIHRATGLDQGTLSKIMNGRVVPYPCQAQKIADCLGYVGDIDALFTPINEVRNKCIGVDIENNIKTFQCGRAAEIQTL